MTVSAGHVGHPDLGPYAPGIADALANLAAPGPSFTGAQRLAIAEVARHAETGRPAGAAADEVGDPVADAARTVAVAATTIDGPLVAEWEAAGLDRVAYAELVGVVGRIRAIDTFCFGLGVDERPLPPPKPGDPTGDIAPGSRIRTGFVPVPRLLSPSRVVSALPTDYRAQDRLSETLYLSNREMDDLTIVKDLDRAQLELVAARTSLLNNCFW